MKLFVVLLLPWLIVAAQRGNDIEAEIADAAVEKSGYYLPLNQTKLVEPLALTGVLFDKSFIMPKSPAPYGTCPKDLQLAVYPEGEKLKIDVPSGLHSPSGCNVTEWTYTESFKKRNKGRNKGFHTKINKDAFRCGDSKYRRIRLSTLRTILEPIFSSALAESNIPAFIINAALGNPKPVEDPPPYWVTNEIAHIVASSSLEIKKLDEFHTLQLGFVGVKGMNSSCNFLLGGTPEAMDAAEVIQNFVPYIAQLIAHAGTNKVEQKPISKFYAAMDCVSDVKTLQLQSLPHNILQDLKSKEMKQENLVSINCELCRNTSKLHTVYEAEISKADKTSEDALQLGRDLVAFQEKKTRSNFVTENSTLRYFYPTVAEKIMNTLGKSSIYVAEVHCDNVIQRSPIHVAIVRQSAYYFLCNESFFSKIDGISCGDIEEKDDVAAFIVRDGTKCLLSSDEAVAREIRSLESESEPSLEPSPEPSADNVI